MLRINAVLIREILETEGRSQKQLAAAANRSQSFISAMLSSGKATSASLRAVAKALGRPMESLLESVSVTAPSSSEEKHNVSGDWKGTFTLLLSRVPALINRPAEPVADEQVDIEGEILVFGDAGSASFEFHSKRRNKIVYLPDIEILMVDGTKLTFQYNRESDEDVRRLGSGIANLNQYGDTLAGFYTTSDPAFDGTIIPAYLELWKSKGNREIEA